MKRVSIAVALTVLIVGCSLFYRDPTVRIADVRVVGMGFSGGTAEVVLEVENPNRFTLEVREFRYLLEVAEGAERWAELAAGVSADTVRLPRRSTEEVTLLIPFQLRAVGSALRSWLETGEIGYRIQGDIRARGPMGEVDLPFRSSGTVTP